MRLFLLGFSICIVLTAAAATSQAAESVWTSKRKNKNAPPAAVLPSAGEYSCYTLAMGGMVATPYGAAPTVTPMPSAIERVKLDGKNAYRHSSGKGRYRYDSSSGKVVVESGPFEGWAVRSETDGQKRWLRFAAKKGAQLAATSRLGDHICSLE